MKQKKKLHIVETTVLNNLCIGCGLCDASCPETAISMHWSNIQTWVAQVDENKCTRCGICAKVCPNTPKRISDYAKAAAEEGEQFGLHTAIKCFISYDLKPKNRIRSASGGSVNLILRYLLDINEVDGVIGSVPVMAPIGKPHYELKVFRTAQEFDKARSSHYYPLKYDRVVREIGKTEGRYALIGTPCIIRGIEKLPKRIRNRIRYTFCLICSHSVSGQFLDSIAIQEGISQNEPFIANLRDKLWNLNNANDFNNSFKLSNREIRRNRFKTAFTYMWRNYFFTYECCLYCPDFYGVDADISVKDAWGRLSSDPLGISLLIVRNPHLVNSLQKCKKNGELFLKQCDVNEVFQSQPETPKFKHVDVHNRLVWKPQIQRELAKINYPLGLSRRILKKESHKYWRFRITTSLSSFFYTRWGRLPPKLWAPLNIIKNMNRKIRFVFGVLRRVLVNAFYIPIAFVKHPVSRCPPRIGKKDFFRVIIAGGYGYANTGDEAQLSTVISQWKQMCPNTQLTLLSPNPEYTKKEHGEHSELAPRVTLFNSKKNYGYHSSNVLFRTRYRFVSAHMLFLTRLYRKGLPLISAYPHEVHLLNLIANADVLHLSGGGYLTGMTLSRLWDNMLLIRIADLLGTPVILSGQTIGIFKDEKSKKLAHTGLKKAKIIYLRDPEGSVADLRSIGLQGSHIKSTFDDALFCEIADDETINNCLEENGVTSDPYIVVIFNFGFEIVIDRVLKRLADICDYIVSQHNKKVVFLPLATFDTKPLNLIQAIMLKDSKVINYNFDYRITKGIISRADVCISMKHHGIIFAMGTLTPTIAIALDDYYVRKNAGALQLFKQEQWLNDKKELFSLIMEKKIDDILENIEEQKSIISSHLKELKKQDGEVVRRFLEIIGIDRC